MQRIRVTSQFFSVCKQVYKEAMPILYSENTFRFVRIDHIPCFQRIVGHTSVARVTSIIITNHYLGDAGSTEVEITLLEKLPALRQLCFRTCSVYRALRSKEDQLPKVSELQPGTIISASSEWAKPRFPSRLKLSRDMANWFLERQDLEVTVEVRIVQVWLPIPRRVKSPILQFEIPEH